MWRQPVRSGLVRQGLISLWLAALASCVAPPAPAPRPAPVPQTPPPALPAAQPGADWRDVPLTPGRWTWRGMAGRDSIAQYGMPGGAVVFAMRCDLANRAVIFSRAAVVPGAAPSMTVTTSFAAFALPAQPGGGSPPAIVAQIGARDGRLDQIAFSRGRFLVDVAGQSRLVLPAWPEVARVIEDCRF